ncbi:ArsR/SmtB family transcription factor [Lacticaseibacillus jixiensis]|uniref:ArsR/SmtB family transcription factor n=1 Tax=Lacticaseibacillus jixiensis TaxID=3231926 RepID=UPI0036F351DE
MEIDYVHSSLPLLHALDSQTRMDILNLVAKQKLTVTEVADQLHYSKAIISRHVEALRAVGLIQVSASDSGDHRQKLLSAATDNIIINLPEQVFPTLKRFTYNIPLGNYFSNDGITPTCGLASKSAIIGEMDDPNAFLLPQRLDASLIWFAHGSVEYIIPNQVVNDLQPEMLEISLELSSEFPESNNNWPSDISFWLNDLKVGTYTVPGNYSDVRGRLTPSWWDSRFSQYGLLKHIRIHKDDTGIDGQHLSAVSLKDLNLDHSQFLHLRIGIDSNAANQGGLTLFGKHFGNTPQDIKVVYYYSVKNK